MTNPTYNARDLWASMGVPYMEQDNIEARITTAVRTMLHAGRWVVSGELTADAEVVSP